MDADNEVQTLRILIFSDKKRINIPIFKIQTPKINLLHYKIT